MASAIEQQFTSLRDRIASTENRPTNPLDDAASDLAEAFGSGCCGSQRGSRQERERMVEQARKHERRRISQELHDGLAPALYLLTMKAGALSRRVDELGVADIRDDVQDLQRTADAVSRDLREILHLLRGGDLSAAELLAKMEGEVLEISMRTGMEVDLYLCDDLAEVSSARLVQILRIVQEGIRNIEKHAGARTARVHLERRDDVLRLTIEDDGRGFDVKAARAAVGSRFGLNVIRERVTGLGGRFAIRSAPNRGTTLDIAVPFKEDPKPGKSRAGTC